MKRVVRLLGDDDVKLTPRQISLRKYKTSIKGRIASRRYHRRHKADPAYRAKLNARSYAWKLRNRDKWRVYNRVWMQRKRREQRQQQAVN